MVHVYSCVSENEAPVFMYKVMLVESDDCEQLNGPLAEPHTALVYYQDQSTVLLRSQYSQPGHSVVDCQQSELYH